MNYFKYCIKIFIFIGSLTLSIFSRSPFRPADPLMPEIRLKWLDDDKIYSLKSSYFEEHSIFKKYDPKHIDENLLPMSEIQYRYDEKKSVLGTKLDKLAQELVEEIKAHKTKFKHFKLLKGTNFNKKLAAGILVLKFKDYPFVIKIFLETPQSFIQPYSKGWETAFLHVMGCGINRYLSGFTRIKNLNVIRKRINEDPYWKTRVDLPRKWYWVPKNLPQMELTGINIGPCKNKTIYLPSVYAIIADAIDIEETFKMSNTAERTFAIKLAHYIGNRLDPHINNFVIEKETGKIIIIDTELFTAIMGLKGPIYFKTYFSWYLQLSYKCCKDVFGRHKIYRRKIQDYPQDEWMAV